MDYIRCPAGRVIWAVLNIGSQKPDVDDLDLWHRRLADTSHRAMRKAVCNSLRGDARSKKVNITNRKSHWCSCDTCARAKMHQVLLPAVRDRLEGMSPCACMSADVLIKHDIPSRNVYHYFFFVVDHATKTCWVFLLKTRESEHIMAYSTNFVNGLLPSLNIGCGIFYSEGGAEIVAAEVLRFLNMSGVITSHSPRDTNLVTERWVRSVMEKVLYVCCCVLPCLFILVA